MNQFQKKKCLCVDLSIQSVLTTHFDIGEYFSLFIL